MAVTLRSRDFCFGGQVSTPGFLKKVFLAERESSILVVWAAPGGPETIQKDGWLRPPPFWKVSRPPRAVQAPKIDDFRSVKKPCIKKPKCTEAWPVLLAPETFILVAKHLHDTLGCNLVASPRCLLVGSSGHLPQARATGMWSRTHAYSKKHGLETCFMPIETN